MPSRRAHLGVVLSLGLLAAAACKPNRSTGEEDAAPPPLAPMAEVEAALTGIHEALPAELEDVIRFEAVELEEGDLAGAVPAGWEPGALGWNLRPPEETDLGFHTQYGLGLSCAGRCEPKEWKDVLADSEFGQYIASDAFEIVRDENIRPSGRIVVAKRRETLYLAVAWWREGASRYAYCRATLDGRAASAVEAFERACRASRVSL